jgi:hypothetical protein
VIRKLTIYEAAYKQAAVAFEYPKEEELEKLGRLNLQEIERIEFNASYSVRGLKV